MVSPIIWGVITFAWCAYEAYALRRDDDKHQPFTYYVRRLFNTRDRSSVLYWILAGFWLWLGVHFLIDF